MNLQAVQTVVDKYYMGANHQQEDAPLAAFTAESAIPQPSGEFIAAPPSPATVHLGSTAQTEEIKANTMDMDMELESIYENSPESREDIYNQALTIESSSLSEVETKQLDVNNGSHNKSRSESNIQLGSEDEQMYSGRMSESDDKNTYNRQCQQRKESSQKKTKGSNVCPTQANLPPLPAVSSKRRARKKKKSTENNLTAQSSNITVQHSGESSVRHTSKKQNFDTSSGEEAESMGISAAVCQSEESDINQNLTSRDMPTKDREKIKTSGTNAKNRRDTKISTCTTSRKLAVYRGGKGTEQKSGACNSGVNEDCQPVQETATDWISPVIVQGRLVRYQCTIIEQFTDPEDEIDPSHPVSSQTMEVNQPETTEIMLPRLPQVRPRRYPFNRQLQSPPTSNNLFSNKQAQMPMMTSIQLPADTSLASPGIYCTTVLVESAADMFLRARYMQHVLPPPALGLGDPISNPQSVEANFPLSSGQGNIALFLGQTEEEKRELFT